MRTYKALVGLTYPVGSANIDRARKHKKDEVTEWKRVEPGETADDIPAPSIPWLLRSGRIEPVGEPDDEGGED